MFQVLCILATFETIINAIELLYTFHTEVGQKGKLIQFLYQTVITLIVWTIWGLGRRFKDQYVLMIATNFLIVQLSCALRYEFLTEQEDMGTVTIGKINGFLIMYATILARSFSFMILY